MKPIEVKYGILPVYAQQRSAFLDDLLRGFWGHPAVIRDATTHDDALSKIRRFKLEGEAQGTDISLRVALVHDSIEYGLDLCRKLRDATTGVKNYYIVGTEERQAEIAESLRDYDGTIVDEILVEERDDPNAVVGSILLYFERLDRDRQRHD